MIDAMINFNRTHAVWFCHIEAGADFLGVILEEEGMLKFRWRVRHPDGDKRWCDQTPRDRKSPGEMLTACRIAAHLSAVAVNADGEVQEIVRGALNDEEWARLILVQPWAHVLGLPAPGHA